MCSPPPLWTWSPHQALGKDQPGTPTEYRYLDRHFTRKLESSSQVLATIFFGFFLSYRMVFPSWDDEILNLGSPLQQSKSILSSLSLPLYTFWSLYLSSHCCHHLEICFFLNKKNVIKTKLKEVVGNYLKGGIYSRVFNRITFFYGLKLKLKILRNYLKPISVWEWGKQSIE